MAEGFQVIDDPNDPRLADTPLNEPPPAESAGTFDDLLDEVFVDEPPVEGAGTFDDLKQDFGEAREVFKGNRGIVLKSLEDYGASKVVQAAILGDIEQESSFNPTLDDHNDPTGAHGLLQVGTPMFREFDAAAQAQGLKRGGKDYVYAQVPFMLDYFRKRNPERWDQMQQMTNAADVVEVFRGDHEGWGYGKAGKRHAYANKFQNLLANIPPGALVAGEVTGAAGEFAKPAAAGNPTFGDLISAQEGEDETDVTKPPPPLQLDDEDYAAAAEHGGDTSTTVTAPVVADVEIPEFLKEPETEEEEAAAPAARHRIAASGGSREIPGAEFITKLPPYELTPISQGAAPQDQFVGTPNGPLIPAPQQQDVAESRFTPLQQSFIDMGMGAANLLPTEQVKGVWDSTKQMILPFGTTEDPNVQYPEGGLPAKLAESFDPEKYGEQIKQAYEEVKKDPNSREAWKHYTTAVATILPMLPKGEQAAARAAINAGEIRGSLPSLHALDIPALEKAWNTMPEDAKMQMAGSKKKFKDLSPEEQRAVAEKVSEVSDYQYSEWEKFSGIADMPTSTAGTQRARSELAKVNPKVLLRQKLKEAEKAGRAGYKRGSKEATASAEEILKAEKEAGKAERRRQKKQLEAQAKADAAEIRETLQTADRWLDADLNTVLANLKKFSMHLPLKERGKLNDMFARVARKPAAWTRNPGRIRKEGEKALNQMAERVYQVNQKRLTKDIAKGLQKIIDSPTVHISQRQIARRMLESFNKMKGYWTLDYLEAMHKRMKNVEQIGRDLYQVSEVMKAEATIASKREIDAQGVLKADLPEHYLVPIEEVPSWWKREIQKWKNIPARLKHFNFVTDSMDWTFVRYDGRFGGAAYRNLKLPIDILTSEYLDTLHHYDARRQAIKDKYKFDERNYRRIATHAMLRQEGGLENLIAKGYTEAEVLPYKDVNSLSKGEQALLKVDDQILKELYPLMRDMYAKHYNIEVGPSPDGYYPWIRDWDAWSSLDIEQKGGFRRSKTESGFKIERQKGAKTVNILDSDLIMNQHLSDVLWTVKSGPEISRLAKLVRDPWFKERFGSFGQQQFLDWVDTLARNGGVEHTRRFPMLDAIKRNIGVGYLGFKLVTGVLQPTAMLLSLPFTKVKSMAGGIRTVIEAREWILKTFPEVRESVKGGKIDDPAYADYTKGLGRVSMAHIRWLDGLARMSAVDAFYRDALAKRGIPYDRNMTPHPEAVAEAQQMVRMTQSGPLAKDVSQALSRGALTGNVSVDQAIFQFQSYTMSRWSELKWAAGRIGIKESNPAARAKVFGYVMLATYMEQLGREGIANVKRAIFGMGEKEATIVKQEQEEGLAITISKKAFVDILGSIPGLSNLSNMSRYGSQGTPVGDTLQDVLADAPRAIFRGKETQGSITLLKSLLAMKGIPTAEIGDALQRISREQARQGQVGPYEDAYRFDAGPGSDMGPGRDSGPGGDSGPGRY